MRHRPLAALLPLLLPCVLVLGAGCRRAPEPVAKLTLTSKQIELPHGRLTPLELRWEPSKPLPVLPVSAPLVFVHLLDAEGNVVRTFDHALPGRWQPGVSIVDRVAMYHSAIGPALPAGDYRLTVGLYDGTKKRFALTVDGEELRRQEYAVAQVKVPETSPSAPAFTFSREWLAVEPGGDRQAVARRWLTGDGSLEARGLAAPARVWMLLRVPEAEPPLRLLLEPGATGPSVRVASDCGGAFSAELHGVGFREVAVPVHAAGPCSIGLDTNYTVVEMGTGRKLSLGLEQLGWEPGAGAMPPSTVR